MKKILLLLIFSWAIGIQVKSQILNVNEHIQQKNQWCWAAATACVLDYYCTPIPQCEIAEYTRTVATWHNFGENNCCLSTASACNYWNYNWSEDGSMQDILVHFANIKNYGSGIISEEEITEDIQNNRLSILRWEYNNGNGHFLVAHGLIEDKLYYMNPWFGEGMKVSTYSWFKKSSTHKWTSTNRIYEIPDSSVALFAENISGQKIVCKGQDTVNYSIPDIENATHYSWSLPAGASGTSTTNSISVSYADSAKSGKMSVKGINDCGEGIASLLHIKVCETPDTAGLIVGKNEVCLGEDSVIYTVPEIEHATSYVWQLPPGASGTSTSNSIVVSFSDTASSGELFVKGENICEEGAGSSLSVKVKRNPLQPSVWVNENVLMSESGKGNQWYNQDGAIEGATEQYFTAIENGDYYVMVHLSGCSSIASETVNMIVTGSRDVGSDKQVKVYPNPFYNELTLENKNTDEEISFEILNAKGQVFFKGNLLDKTTIQTKNFEPGVYFIKFDNGRELEFKKAGMIKIH